MLRRLYFVLATSALLALPSAAMAGDVVQFRDGRYLEVEKYTVTGKFIRLMLEGDSNVSLPVDRIEKIQRGGQILFSPEDNSHAARAHTRAATAITSEPVGRSRHRS